MINYNQSLPQEENSNSGMTLPTPDQAQKLFEMGQLNETTARKLGARIDPAFIEATIQAESSGRAEVEGPITRSGERAQGLMQVMPATGAEVARQLGMTNYDLKNEDDNRAIGSEFLAQQMDKYQDPMLASAAYNAGPGAVDRAIERAGTRDPQAVLDNLPKANKETRPYVEKVMKDYLQRKEDISNTGAVPSDYAAPNMEAPSAKILGIESNIPSPYGTTQSSSTMKSEAVEAASRLGIQKAEEEAAYMRTASREQELMLQERQQKEIERQEAFNQQKTRYEQAREEAANAKIDPDQFWSQKGTGEKIVAGIAIALGALGQGLTRSNTNGALDIINGQIDRNIEAQKSGILAKRDKANAEGNMLQELRIKLGDDRAAESALRVIYLDNVEMNVKTISAKSKSQEVAANRDLLLSEIQAEREKRDAEVSKALAEGILANRKQTFEEQKIINESPANRKDLIEGVVKGVPTEKGVQKLSPEDLPEKDRVRYVDGLGVALTAEDAKKLKEAKTAFSKFDNLLNEMIFSRKEYGWEPYGTEKTIQEGRAAEAILAVKNMEELGALDIGAITIGNKIVPKNPSELRLAGDPVKELEAVRERARKNFHEKIRDSLSVVAPEVEEQLKTTGSTVTFTPKPTPKK